jgi:hypothetical protein
MNHVAMLKYMNNHCPFFHFLNMQQSWAGQSRLHSENKAIRAQTEMLTTAGTLATVWAQESVETPATTDEKQTAAGRSASCDFLQKLRGKIVSEL